MTRRADDPYDLKRFVDAQRGVIEAAMRELAQGRKQTHWMWFVFPQIAGLGFSAMARRYAIEGLGEARAYLSHDVLGPRLEACVEQVLAITGRSAHDIFGSPDDLKFFSSMTLFAEAAGGGAFARTLDAYFAGRRDAATLERL